MKENPQLKAAKKEIEDNLEALQIILGKCTDGGMQDLNDHYYNELLDLIDDVRIATTWEELEEVISIAKTLEVDFDAWRSFHGGSSVSLLWPVKKNS